jgi:hypothetical protein
LAFNLASISRTKRMTAPKILLSGLPKTGKSTFASCAPNPIFIQTEDGLSGIDSNAFPLARSLDDVYAAIETLLTEDHPYETCVLDSADWCETLIHQHVCKANKWDNMESVGYGKSYVAATAEWRKLIDKLEMLRTERSMAIIIIAHVKTQRIESPTHEGYDAWVVKTHAKSAALLEEWADVIGFAAPRIALKKTDAGFGQKENKALATGDRILHLQAHPAYPSGTRFGFEDCDLTWEALANQFPA